MNLAISTDITEGMAGLRIPKIDSIEEIQNVSNISLAQTIFDYGLELINDVKPNQIHNINQHRKTQPQVDNTRLSTNIYNEEIHVAQ